MKCITIKFCAHGNICDELIFFDKHRSMFYDSIRVREIVLSLAGHFKLFAGHLIGFNYSSSPDILKIRETCPASLANFVYSAQ